MNMEWKRADQELPDMHTETWDDISGPVEFRQSDPVLAYAPDCGMAVCTVEIASDGRMCWIDEPGTMYHVTHWMYLPEAPTA